MPCIIGSVLLEIVCERSSKIMKHVKKSKESLLKHHREDFNPKYNSHLKPKQHSAMHSVGRFMMWTLTTLMSLIIIAVVVIAGTLLLYKHADNHSKHVVAEQVERNNRPQQPVYNQSSLNQSSDHNTDRRLVNYYAKADGKFVSHISYNSKKDVAKITLKKPVANAIKYVSNTKKPNQKKLVPDLKKGVDVDDLLSNQAVEIANAAHDGYFTFQFANANGYQAPNTKSGNYNV